MTTRTTCPYCGVGCGVLVGHDGSVRGDPDHPANRGRLCSKGAALGETLGTAGRLSTPRIDGTPATWDAALDRVASRFRDTIAEHGPDSVALYVSGQLLTEDYYVANKLMKGYIGSANIDTNSRLCMASSVAAHRRAFGTDTVPGTYDDLEQADLIVLVGSNLAWCHPVLHQRILAEKARRPLTLITIDPRRTATAETSDLHLAIEPGSDTTLFLGLLREIGQQGAVDGNFLGAHVTGAGDALAAAGPFDPDRVATATRLDPALIRRFYALWIGRERVVTLWSQGANQASDGTDRVSAMINCHLATGRIGRPGMGPFSVTGQPNAMGGREVGGLATMLAAHLDIENPEHRARVQGFWASPRIAARPGLKAVEMFDAVADGRIRAIWVICTNPAVSMPRAGHIADALRACPFVAVSDLWEGTDTARLAHVLLPAAGWGEKDGTVTNSERRISRQRGFLPAPGLARPDWWMLAGVARRMGWAEAFAWDGPAAIFREHAALSGLAARDFDISGLADLDAAAYDALEPVQWPVGAPGRFFAQGGFYTPDGRARMVAVAPRASPNQPTPARPFLLNTGRVRDHWHTMTRTGLSPRLSQHIAEPYLELHPQDATRLGLAPASLAAVESAHGSAILRVQVTDRVRPGHPFAPMHWTGESAAAGRIGALIAPVTDPTSGQPDLKRSAVALTPWPAAWFGFAVSEAEPDPATGYWARARVAGGWRMELADRAAPDDWEAFARHTLRAEGSPVICHDARRGQYRIAYVADGRLTAALFTAPEPVEVARDWLCTALGQPVNATRLLAGRAGSDRPDPGPTVCACFGVGANAILAAITAGGLTSVTAIGASLKAGTNCGSCRPELQVLLDRSTRPLAAE